MSDNPLIRHRVEFLRAFLSAKTPAERGELCREHYAHLLPTDPTKRNSTRWSAINLGNGSTARIGIVETVTDRPGARLLLIRGRKLIRTICHPNEARARHAAYMFDWAGVQE